METVIHYKPGLYLSITETWIYGQIKSLRRYQPIVYTHKTKNLDIYPTKKIKSLKDDLPASRILFNQVWNKLFNSYPYFVANLKKDKPKLIHAHYGPSGYSCLNLKNMFNLPLVTSFYGYDLSLFRYWTSKWKARYKELFRQGDCFLVQGSHMKKSLIQLGCPEDKAIIQYLGVALNQIKFTAREPERNGAIRVLIAGSFREKKGIPYAIEAFARVRKKYKNLWLTIIGDSTGTPREEREKQKILAGIDRWGLDRCVKMMGYQPYAVFLKEIYKHHIFLSPSICACDGDSEAGAPVSIIEASASGMPVVSTYHCDLPEVIMDGESGYLVPERDIDTLAEKLEFLVAHPDIWEEIGRKGREHIEKNYNLITQGERLENIYDAVIKKISLR